MTEELVPITFNKIMQSRSYTVIILGTEQKRFAIYTDPSVGKNIQTYLTEEHKPRPYTHDLINAILRGFDVKPAQNRIDQIVGIGTRLMLFGQIGLDIFADRGVCVDGESFLLCPQDDDRVGAGLHDFVKGDRDQFLCHLYPLKIL